MGKNTFGNQIQIAAVIDTTTRWLGNGYLFAYSLLPIMIGAISAAVVYVAFLSGLFKGPLFPEFGCHVDLSLPIKLSWFNGLNVLLQARAPIERCRLCHALPLPRALRGKQPLGYDFLNLRILGR
jgi:hypothetical protein